MKTIAAILQENHLFSDGKKIPTLDIELLLSLSLKKERSFLFSHSDYQLTSEEFDLFENLLNRRSNFEPYAYIEGFKYFYGYKFKVNKNVLIPRPETEDLVTESIKALKSLSRKEIHLIEVGSGSGCIPISIALEASKFLKNQKLIILSIDISKEALKVARENLETYQEQITNVSIKFEQCDIFDALAVKKLISNTKFDLVVSNPPYVETEKIKTLAPDIKNYEPRLALDGGDDGEKFFRALGQNLTKNIDDQTQFILEGIPSSFIFTGDLDEFKAQI